MAFPSSRAATRPGSPRASLRRGALVALLVGGLPTVLFAQGTGTIGGRVHATAGEPLQGASVSIVGTQRGTASRADGSFRLVVPAGSYEVRARLIGFASKTSSVVVPEGGSVTVDFALEHSATVLEAVATIGTRGQERSVTDAPVPIDVLSTSDIRQMGRTETAQMIQAAAPSFNFPRASIGDGTDHIRPASLRGLAPDQVLVLVNGKRRHAASLVNVNGTIGRGSQPVDLNAIPASMIERIEILRDGAAAQYGSDAIAGVINVVLKSQGAGEVTATAGQYFTTYNRDAGAYVLEHPALFGVRKARDGKTLQVAANHGFQLGERSFLYVGGELRDRGETNRTLGDPRPQYFSGDARNANAPAINHRQGDAYLHDLAGFLNAGTTLANGVELYAFGGASRRFGDAAGFWRRPNDDRTLRNLYPDGFLPVIQSHILDVSGSAGARGTTRGWQWDLSSVYGRNAFDFDVVHSANVSLGPTSPTRFYAGQLHFGQSTTDLDLVREFASAWKHPLRVALGAELRADMYGIGAGEESSYKDGKQCVLTPSGSCKLGSDGKPVSGAVGSQVFPGFTPADAGDHSRTNTAAYVDLESKLVDALTVSAAGRYEHYSDFGSTTNGKLAARYQVQPGLAIRGAASTGFRAPTLGQEFFSSTATNFIAGVPYDIKTLPPTSEAAQVLGATPLKPEKSRNLSAGVAFEPTRSLSVTVDAYQINIDDRIVFSENFTDAKIRQLFTAKGFNGIGGARYFTNAIDTRTRGVDVVTNYGLQLPNGAVLRLTGGFNRSQTKVLNDVVATPPQLKGFESVLFGRVERTRIERGQPLTNLLASASLERKGWAFTGRTHRYGTVLSYGTPVDGSLDQSFGAKWITDVSASRSLFGRYTVSVGADNVFDVYPDRNNNWGKADGSTGGNANFGIFPYSGVSPFGFNGRFVYTRVSVGL